MTRQEYLEQMQSLREDLQSNARKYREDLDVINDEYRQKLTQLNEEKRQKERQLRDSHTAHQHDVERKMHELKVQWAIEHPLLETKVVQ